MSEGQSTIGAHLWADAIRKGADAGRSNDIVRSINEATANRRANRGDVMVACASILAQSIVSAGPDDAADMRAGIAALIDGFAMQLAVGGSDAR
jgi:hypothetical protein